MNNKIFAIDERQISTVQQALARTGQPAEAHIKKQLLSSRTQTVYTKNRKRAAVIPITGVISQGQTLLSYLLGGTSTEEIGYELEKAVNDKGTDNIILNVHSPGGSVYGVMELANKIYAARKKKKIYAISNSLCASAAYWLASQAHKVYCTPGGEIGSVGVIAVHTDISKLNEAAGVKVSIFKAGRYKAEGNPYEALSEETKRELQKGIDFYYGKFVEHVARGRGVSKTTVLNGFGQGRVLLAHEALQEGMIDRVRTFDNVISDPRFLSAGSKEARDIKRMKAAAEKQSGRTKSIERRKQTLRQTIKTLKNIGDTKGVAALQQRLSKLL